MKTKLSRRNFKFGSRLLLGVAAAHTAVAQDATEETRNWVDFTVGGNLVHGDKAAFQQRTQTPRDAFGGISDFHYELDVGKQGLFEVDGRGIYDDNYSIGIKYTDPSLFYVEAGFEHYNNYYDGSGGYWPVNGQFFRLFDEEMIVERGKIFFEAGLTLENKPQVRVRYSYDYRDGEKNSTSWGDTSQTGVAAPFNTKKLVPSFLRLDENRHSIGIDASHTIQSTMVGLGGRAEFSSYDNGRYLRRNPGEPNDRFITHREGQDTDLYHAHAWTDTDLNTQWKLTTGYSFTRLDADISGSRFYGRDYDDVYDPIRQQRDHGFLNLIGASQLDQHVATISAMYRPTDHITIVPALRVEDFDQTGHTEFRDTETGAGAAPRPITAEDIRNTRERGFLDLSESIEARYTGVTNWLFYVRGEWLQGDGTLNERETFVEDATTAVITRDTDSSRFTQKYIVGATWYPHRKLNAAVQYYHKTRENEFEHTVANTEGLYPGFIRDQDFKTDDANIRVTWRPLNNLTFVSRYDFQMSDITSQMGALAEVRSAESTRHIITEAVTWSPISRMYIQASGSYTYDQLETPANFIVPRVQVSENDYYTASGTIGFALTDKADLTANYNFYFADNYDTSIVPTGVPYGAGLEEHSVGGSLLYRFSKRMHLVTRYAFITSHDETSGGNNDFDAHLLATTLRLRF